MKSALLIIDVQTALCTGEWAAFDIDNVVDRINALSHRARRASMPVVLIQHEDDAALRFATEGWKLYERPAVQPEDMRIRKTASDSFYRTELHSALQAGAINHLIDMVCKVSSA